MFLSLLHVNVGKDPGRKWLRDLYRVHQRLWMAFPDAQRKTDDPFFLGAWNGPASAEPKPKRSETGFLFRIERDGSPQILVQSIQRPDWEYAFQNAPYLLASKQVRQFDPSLSLGQTYRFRLLANVVERRSVVHPNGRTRTTQKGLTIPRKRRTETPVHPEPIPETLPTDPVERDQLFLARWDPWRMWLGDLGAKHGFRLDERKELLRMESVHANVHRSGHDRGSSNGDKPSDKRYNAGLFDGVLVCNDPDRLHDAIVNGIATAKAFGFGLLSIAPAEAMP